MSRQTDYLDQLQAVVREQRQVPLAELILARVSGNPRPVHGISSPPLGREEPDANLLLYHLYQRLADDEVSRDYLRGVVTKLILEQLALDTPRDGDAHSVTLDLLVQLGGFVEIDKHPQHARALRWGLWGMLSDFFPKPFDQLIQLEGRSLRDATRVFDLWLAVTPPLCDDLQPSANLKVSRLWEESEHYVRHGQACRDDRYDFLLLAFRAYLKVCPEPAGRRGLAEMVGATAVASQLSPHLRRRWLALCWELGVVMAEDKRWCEKFSHGLKNAPSPQHEADLYALSLREMGLADLLAKPSNPASLARSIPMKKTA